MSDANASYEGVIGRTYRESTPWWPSPVRAPAGAPNVVFVVLDDVGFADLGCYGSEIDTPVMDRLAAGGLRYTNFHTTAMCSPTRACLLTGRNAHAAGMGIIAEFSSGYPAYSGRVTPSAANLAEMLRPRGYNTLAAGKWHLMPMTEATAAGPFDDWPLGRGFDRWYGFHSALADSWHPELFEDNHAIETPGGEGYHLSEDLVDQSIRFVRDQQSAGPDKPFFLYLAFGAVHWPHHVPRDYIEKYRGRYDAGWDAARAQRLARQKALGIVPPDTELAPRNLGVRPWDAVSADERRLFARHMEVYAGFLDHTDVQLGRLVSYLEEIGRLDDTLIVLLSDNGASPEAGAAGAINGRRHLQYQQDTAIDGLAAIDDLGSDRSFNHYPMGWAQVSNTPLKWYKKDVHAGGARDPLIIHWPARIADRGGLRHQFHHVVDVVPTVLELLGVEAPAVHRGVAQLPIHGTSLAYTFDAPDDPTRKQTQYFELLGDRALWHKGWKVVARHEKDTDFEQDRWELYHLDEDFSECRDRAAEQPERVREMVERWWAEAGRYGVMPLDDREYDRTAETAEVWTRRVSTYLPGMARLDRFSAPNIADRSYVISAEVEIPEGGAEGVLLASGTGMAGYVLYLKDGRLHYEYRYSERERVTIASDAPVPSGPCTLRYEFRRTGPRRGVGTLYVDERAVGSVEVPRTWPIAGVNGGLYCGRDDSAPVSDAYHPPFAFTGGLRRVVVELEDDGRPDRDGGYRSALAEA